jgi:hypothetical protein
MRSVIALACCFLATPSACTEGEALLEDIKIPNTCEFSVVTKVTVDGTTADSHDGMGGAIGKAEQNKQAVEDAISDGNHTIKTPERILCRPAVFGDQNTEINPSGRPGRTYMNQARPVAMGNDKTACSAEVCNEGRCDKKVVLVFRGGCGFYQKAKNIWASSKGRAAAILIADNGPATNGMPMTMSRGGEQKHEWERFMGCPVAAIYKEAGEEMEREIATGNTPLMAMNFGKHKDRENEYMIKKQIKEMDGMNNTMSWHNLAVSFQNQHKTKQAILALSTSAAVGGEKTAFEVYQMLSDLYKDEGEKFLAAKAMCAAATTAARQEIAAGHRPTTSNKHRVEAMKIMQGTYEGGSMKASKVGPCDMVAIDGTGIENAWTVRDLFRGKPYAKGMYPADPSMWADEDREA